MDTAGDDGVLLARAAHGDDAALRTLMDRYDRLVRYTIFRLSRREARLDPQWLDARAVDVWTGALRAGGKGLTLAHGLAPYLVSIARNRTLSALKARAARSIPQPLSADEERASLDESHESLVDRVDDLSRLREALARLDGADQRLLAALPQILDRQWQMAGDILGLPESTVRSQWKVLITKLTYDLNARGSL